MTFDKTKKGFLSLPAELRNVIYEDVLADVQDNICIDLTRGPNKGIYKNVHTRTTNTQQKAYLTSGHASPLSILLTCRTVNKEASAMAYSKISIAFEFVDTDMTKLVALWDTHGTKETRAEFARRAREAEQRIKTVLKTFARTFRASNRSHITHLHIHSWEQVKHLRDRNSRDFGSVEFSKRCTKKCDRAGVVHRGLVHNTFHHIRRITFQEPAPPIRLRDFFSTMDSWFARYVSSPEEVEELLGTFPNLEEIMVRHVVWGMVRRTRYKQTYYVRDGRVYSASGLLIGGRSE